MVCILAGTGLFTENSALSLAKMGSLQLEWVNMCSVLAERALVQHSSVAVIREGTETAALLVGSRVPVVLVLGVLHVSSRFFTYAGSSGILKMRKPTYPTNKLRNHFSSFLTISAFLCHRSSTKKLNCWKPWGSWGVLETSKSLSCDLCRWVLCYTHSATFYFEIKQVSCS